MSIPNITYIYIALQTRLHIFHILSHFAIKILHHCKLWKGVVRPEISSLTVESTITITEVLKPSVLPALPNIDIYGPILGLFFSLADVIQMTDTPIGVLTSMSSTYSL